MKIVSAMQQHFKINYDKFLVYAFVIQDKNLETLWNLENVPALIDLEIHSNVLGPNA